MIFLQRASSELEELEKRRKERQKKGQAAITLGFQMRIWIDVKLVLKGASAINGIKDELWKLKNGYKNKSTTTTAKATTTEEEIDTDDNDDDV